MTARLVEDPHLWGITLFDELQALGFGSSYQTLTRQIGAGQLRPVCADCGRATERANAVIPHPAGEETQWDWLAVPDPPATWGWGSMAHLLVGSLVHSGRWRGYQYQKPENHCGVRWPSMRSGDAIRVSRVWP